MAVYIDRATGSDSNDGGSWETAWASLDKLDGFSAGAVCTIYIKSGVYYLTKDISVPIQAEYGYTFVGVGQVIIKNPFNKKWNSSHGQRWTGYYMVSTNANLNFMNICFSMFGDAVKLFNFTGDSGGTIRFSNCSFYGKLINTYTAALSNINVNHCTVMNGDTIPEYLNSNPTTNPFYVDGVSLTISQDANTNSTSGVLRTGNIVVSAASDYPTMRGAYVQKIKQYCKASETGFTAWPDSYYETIPCNLTGTSAFNALTTGWAAVSGDETKIAITDSLATGISLISGTSGQAISPVYEMFNTVTLKAIPLIATEAEVAPGSNVMIDSTPGDTARTIEYRISDTQFLPLDASPTWVTYTRGEPISATGKFIQYKITFVTNAA